MNRPFNGRTLERAEAVILTACALWLVGCNVTVEQDGPGPVGPVGPIGSVGEEIGEPGSGIIATEERDAAGVTRVHFASEGEVYISLGPATSLTVEADDNLLTHLETVVEEDILRIQTAQGIQIAPSRPPRFHLTMPEVTEVELSGVGAIEVESAKSGILSMTLSGVGDVTFREVDVDLLLYDLSGVGTLSVGGEAEDQRGSVAGQCRFLAADLESERAMLQASGGGYAVISVGSALEVSVNDSATVEYYGSPSVTQDVGDLGSLTSLGRR